MDPCRIAFVWMPLGLQGHFEPLNMRSSARLCQAFRVALLKRRWPGWDRVPTHGVARWQQSRPRCAFAWLAVRAALRMGIGDLGWVWVASLNRDLQNPDDRCDDGAEWLA